MNLQAMLAARLAANKPVRVGLVGAGKFGSMFLAQMPTIARSEEHTSELPVTDQSRMPSSA